MISARRRVGAIIFGFVYGGSLVNGLNTGLGYVVGNREYSVDETLYLGLTVYWLSTVLMGYLAGYVGRSVFAGSMASGIGAALLVVAPGLSFLSDVPPSFTLFVVSATALGIGTIVAAFSSRLKVAPDDLQAGRILGVSWKHWLWLWLPWQYVIANVIWLGTPRFMLTSGGTRFVVGDIVKSAIGVSAAAYAGYMALRTLRADGKFTRTRSAVQFVAWFLIAPILVNLWRLFL
jgi:hypothetical protein